MTGGSDPAVRALPTGDGRFVVPANRWDLLAEACARDPLPRVSVVIPYYDAPAQLERALAGLSVQDYPADRFEVIVADDGSPQPPVLPLSLRPDGGVPVTLVRQPDRGFAAAAARNLGARAATGEVLCWLDQDTVPEPSYLRELVRLPGLAPDVLVAGRRCHADLTGWDAQQVTGWLTGLCPPPAQLLAPAWLEDEYLRSGDLLAVHDLSHRFVISAVMACSARLFAEIGGFDESFTAYGGEDWELAFRAHNAGAVLAHARRAVAWHDGPDWAGRGDETSRRAAKAAERRALRALIPTRLAEAGHGVQPPDVVVDASNRLDGSEPVDAAAVRRLLQSPRNILLCLDSRSFEWCRSELPDAGSRIAAGPPPAAVLDRSRYQVTAARVPGPELLDEVLEPLESGRAGRSILWPGPGPGPRLVAVATRAVRRTARWQSVLDRNDLLAELFGVVTTERTTAGAQITTRADALAPRA